jgi:hypothetical protein
LHNIVRLGLFLDEKKNDAKRKKYGWKNGFQHFYQGPIKKKGEKSMFFGVGC